MQITKIFNSKLTLLVLSFNQQLGDKGRYALPVMIVVLHQCRIISLMISSIYPRGLVREYIGEEKWLKTL